MKQTGKLLLVYLAVILVLPLVFAAGEIPAALQWSSNFLFNTSGFPDIVTFMVWIVLFVGISDLIVGVAPFSNWVCWVIGLATTVIAAQVGWITGISVWMNTAFAALGAFAIYAILICSVLALLGVSWAGAFLIRLKYRKAQLKAEVGTNKVGDAIKNLAHIEDQIKIAGKRF